MNWCTKERGMTTGRGRGVAPCALKASLSLTLWFEAGAQPTNESLPTTSHWFTAPVYLGS